MNFLVYKITNLVNGKFYIGAHQTTNKEDGYLGSGSAIKRAHKKYGKSAFKREIIFEASSKEEMFAKEKELVSVGVNSYNLVAGGITGAPFGVQRKEEIRAKISASKKGRPVSAEHRAKLSIATRDFYKRKKLAGLQNGVH